MNDGGGLMTFGKWLRSAREFHGYTLDEVASKAGTSKSYVWELENDKCVPGLSVAGKITRVFWLRALECAEGD
jgi:transcriptional regulator with XRE-family HTH domain